jgi:g-D-glutamyl-meso-diaminopimelate peptidase
MDINRNFPSKLWNPKFEGDHAASENETKALIFLFLDYNRSKGFLDFHSRGKQIYYYRNQMPDSYNNKQYEIACRLKKVTNYELVPPEEEIDPGDSGGNTVHYFAEHFRKPALTIETVEEDAQFPLDISFRFTTFEETKLVIFKFASMII